MYKTTSKRGQPLYKGQKAGSQVCPLLRGSIEFVYYDNDDVIWFQNFMDFTYNCFLPCRTGTGEFFGDGTGTSSLGGSGGTMSGCLRRYRIKEANV